MSFDHVNCQVVIHITPNSEASVKEIARILKANGTATISVYYRNISLRSWNILRVFGSIFSLFGARLKGRGLENIFKKSNVDEIIRHYDGSENPIGKSDTKKAFPALLSPYFEVEDTYLHFFPARTLLFKTPKFLHRYLDRNFEFMIYATLRKRCAA